MTAPDPIAHVEFADRLVRPVFADGDRQYVVDDAGQRVYGLWFVLDWADEPIIVGPDDCDIPF